MDMCSVSYLSSHWTSIFFAYAIDITGIILSMESANNRRCCTVTLPVINWAHAQNDTFVTYTTAKILPNTTW